MTATVELPLVRPLERDIDERAARRDLRTQIARLERSLGRLRSDSFPRQGFKLRAGERALQPGRVLDLAELERLRDSMVEAMVAGRAELGRRRLLEADYRDLITEMERNPAAHKWERISNLDIGEPGCKHWHARPRWGILGALLGWWRVKVSSGCPLARGLSPAGGLSLSRPGFYRFATWPSPHDSAASNAARGR